MRSSKKPPKLAVILRQELKLLKDEEPCLGDNGILEAYQQTFLRRHPWVASLLIEYEIELSAPKEDWQ